MLTVLEAIQNWICFERYLDTDLAAGAPNVLSTTLFEFPEDSIVGRRLWINMPWLDRQFGPFRVATWEDAHTITIEGAWPNDMPLDWIDGQFPNYILQSEFAAAIRRMEFMTHDRQTNPIQRPAGTDMPRLVMGPVVGEHQIKQHSNAQIEVDFLIRMELETPGHYIDPLLKLGGMLIDRVIAGRVDKSGSLKLPFRIPDDSTGYQRATLGPLETRRVADLSPENQQLQNYRYTGSMDLHVMILRRAV